MAVEVVTLHWCDVCQTRDSLKQESVQTVSLSVGTVTRTVDLCEVHVKEPVPIAGLADWLSIYGTPPAPTKRR